MTKPDTTKPGLKPGTVDAAGVRAVVNQHLGGVRSCFDRGRMEDPQLAGRVVMIIALTPLGEVGDARVGSTELHSATTETCLIKLVRGLQFPAPAGQVAATISYPFVFK